VVTSIGPALDFGAESLGSFYIYGTAANILTSSRAFKEFYDNAEKLGYAKIWIPGTRMYYPFFGNPKTDVYYDAETDTTVDAIPNLRHLKPFERVGCEDLKAAEAEIIRKRSIYLALHKRKKLKEFMQDYPLTEEEAFTSSGSNNFNNELLISQLMNIEGSPVISPWILDFVKTRENGITKVKYPFEVTARPAKQNDKEWETIWIYQHPRKDILDLDVGGFDSYNQDLTETSKSLGAVVIVRDGATLNMDIDGIHKAIYPVALYYARPPRKEICYEIALKMAVYYNTAPGNMMINAEQDFAIEYFTSNYGMKYLSPRPKSFDSPKTQQVHKYGLKLTGPSKDVFLGALQSIVEDYTQYNFFPRLIRDTIAYDEILVGEGDWDATDAFGLANARIIDRKTKPRKDLQQQYQQDDEAIWTTDNRGNFVPVKDYDSLAPVTPAETPAYKEAKGGWREVDPVYKDKEYEKLSTESDYPFD
jgi:hypothetical protein